MRKPKPPQIVTVVILTTVTIILWIFFGVYRILTAKPPAIVPEKLLAPIDANLNKKALENIEFRVFFEEEDIPETPVISPIPQATPPAEGPVEETESSSLSPTPTATQSGIPET